MKIDPNVLAQQISKNKSSQATSTASDGQFGAILKETMEKQPVNEVATSAATSETVPLPSIDAVRMQRVEATSRTEELLDLLDAYRQRLESPEFNLRQLEPLIEKLENQKENLVPLLDSLSGSDQLKGILNEALVTVSGEIVRFRGGQYLSS